MSSALGKVDGLAGNRICVHTDAGHRRDDAGGGLAGHARWCPVVCLTAKETLGGLVLLLAVQGGAGGKHDPRTTNYCSVGERDPLRQTHLEKTVNNVSQFLYIYISYIDHSL